MGGSDVVAVVVDSFFPSRVMAGVSDEGRGVIDGLIGCRGVVVVSLESGMMFHGGYGNDWREMCRHESSR